MKFAITVMYDMCNSDNPPEKMHAGGRATIRNAKARRSILVTSVVVGQKVPLMQLAVSFRVRKEPIEIL